ncbi:interleukin-13 receptor subunit alpha-2 [Ambystoma mexicanum]|uniref:interleukin-13 receptor subunit alpha-2 n=1 Tax=Ambystoma mexicanum TaxID=8296 RepID=UPI0037E975BB
MARVWTSTCGLLAVFPIICCGTMRITVEPPTHFKIADPGYLGWMVLQWQPPIRLPNLSHCDVKYKLQYRNGDGTVWKTVVTKSLQYSDGFDLSKEIHARLRTLLKGTCTNRSEVWSKWTEAHLKPSFQDAQQPPVKHFNCLFHNWQHLVCSWQPGSNAAASTNYEFRYWHKNLPQASTCDNYLQSQDVNVGCSFRNQTLDDYTDLFVCVTGYEGSTSHSPSYFRIELQNTVKPYPPEHVNVTLSQSEWRYSQTAVIEWHPPEGKVPPQCLEYETHITEDKVTWKDLPIQSEITSTVYSFKQSHSLCARVRGKVNIFCADDGFWSEWSPTNCLQEATPEEDVILFIGLGAIFPLFCFINIVLWICKKRFNVKEKVKYPVVV